MSRYLSTRNISSKSVHAFLSNLANRQTDKQTNTGKTRTSSFVGSNNISTPLGVGHLSRDRANFGVARTAQEPKFEILFPIVSLVMSPDP